MSGKPLGIVHRDISPPNILISKMGEVKLVDFGLAKATSQIELTDPGVVKGKFSYLSPEAASGLEVDHRADIFAVGILLWEMLTGRRLFYGDSDYGTVELVRQAKVPSVIALNPEVEPELEQVVRKALARDPKDRYAQAADLQDAIAQYLFSRGLKVTSRDIAHLVQDTVAEKERAKAKTAGNVSHLIDVLIQEEIAKFTSLEDMAGKQQDNTPASTTGGDALDPGAFIDTRAWVDDLSTEGDAALLNGASRATHETQDEPKEARRRTPPALPKVSQQAASALDSLQQILEPDRTITRQLLARGKRRGKAALVIIVVLVLALAVGGVVYFRDRLPGARPAGAETQGNNP
ncbi:MAG: serine/threonine protein kinase [Deltaproteobacteria bacterium]|nr:serine/threonine protein kinase [Deltaproteobacteria bacterium]